MLLQRYRYFRSVSFFSRKKKITGFYLQSIQFARLQVLKSHLWNQQLEVTITKLVVRILIDSCTYIAMPAKPKCSLGHINIHIRISR